MQTSSRNFSIFWKVRKTFCLFRNFLEIIIKKVLSYQKLLNWKNNFRKSFWNFASKEQSTHFVELFLNAHQFWWIVSYEYWSSNATMSSMFSKETSMTTMCYYTWTLSTAYGAEGIRPFVKETYPKLKLVRSKFNWMKFQVGSSF